MRLISRLLTSAFLLVLTLLLVAFAKYQPDLFFSFYPDFSRAALGFLSRITGLVPLAVWEIAVLVMVVLAFYFLFKNKKFLTWLSGILLLAVSILFLFTTLWGLNHFDPTTTADRVGLHVTKYSQDQLEATVRYMSSQANHWADQVSRDETGAVKADFSAWAPKASDAYEALARENPFFRDSGAPVKPLASSRLFSYMGITGIFMAYTGECNVNTDIFPLDLPFTMCHELAHRMTVAAEDEANFCAFLACIEADDPAFQYSAWYSAYVYTYNALYRTDRKAALALRETFSPTLLEDSRRANEHYARYDGQVQEVATKANDTYLKVFNEESGVRSYGEVADLLIAWYLQEVAG